MELALSPVEMAKSAGMAMVALVSLAAGAAAAALLSFLGPPDVAIYAFFAVGFLPAAAVYGVVAAYDRDIGDRAPDLFDDLAEHVRASGSIIKALQRASSANYGVLSEELLRTLAEVEDEGYSLAAALKALAVRVKNAYVTRSVAIVAEALTSSSDIAGVLKMVAAEGRLSRALEAERRSGIAVAIVVMYLAALIFLAVVSLCTTSLLPMAGQLQSLSAAGPAANADRYSQELPYYALSISVAVCTGLTIGVMRDSSAFGGLKDAAAIATIAFLVYHTIVFPGLNPLEAFGL